MSRPRIGIATCLQLPEPDHDESRLLDAFRSGGSEPTLVAWDDDAQQLAGLDLCLLRSTWNYHHHLDAFLTWTRRAATATRLVNSPAVVARNAHKSYLLDLQAAGVPVVPTQIISRAARDPRLPEEAWALGTEIVIKPAVSAGSFATRRFRHERAAEAQTFLETVLRERDALVQPYIRSVDDHGERCLVFLGGELSHAVRKQPRFAGDAERVSGPLPVDSATLAVAQQALAWVGDELLYARVDLVLDEQGAPCVAELELIEPSLFLSIHPPACDRLVAAVLARLESPRRPG